MMLSGRAVWLCGSIVKAMVFPSGDHAGGDPATGFVVIFFNDLSATVTTYMSERVSRSIVVGAAWKASRVPSGDQLGAPLTVRLPCATSVACFVATSITHACERRKVSSNTCASSRTEVLASSVLGSVSTARKAMREPSVDHSKPL